MNCVRNKIVVGVLVSVILFSCKKEICPAYQSSFLLNKEDQDKYFSYFQESEEEEAGTAITDIHHDMDDGANLSTDFSNKSGTTPRGEEYPIQPSIKNNNGITIGPVVKNKKSKSYKKKHYIVEMKDVYAEDSTSIGGADSLQTESFSDTGDKESELSDF